MLPFEHYLPWAISPAVASGLGIWWQQAAASHKERTSKRGLGLVRLIGVLTRDQERRRVSLEIIRLGREDLTGTSSYVDPPPSGPPPERS